MTIIHYLGNEFIKEDSLAIDIVKKIKGELDKVKFEKIDTFEKMIDIKENQHYIDVCKGVKKPTLINNINTFLNFRRTTAHDLDFSFFLKLKHKLGEIKKINIICLPSSPYPNIETDAIKIIQKLEE